MTSPADAFEEVTGALLIGGKSRRFGRDKIFIPFNGKPLILHLYDLFQDFFPHIILIGHFRPELEKLGLSCYEDILPGKGVLGGIYTALKVAHTPYVFVAGADMPFLTSSVITSILDHRHGPDAVIPQGPKGLEPLSAIYSTSCIGVVEENLNKGTLKVMEALSDLTVSSPKITPAGGQPDPFTNVNYPEDVEILGRSD